MEEGEREKGRKGERGTCFFQTMTRTGRTMKEWERVSTLEGIVAENRDFFTSEAMSEAKNEISLEVC